MIYEFQVGDRVQVALPPLKHNHDLDAFEWAPGTVVELREYWNPGNTFSPVYVVHGDKSRPYISHVRNMIRTA